MTARRRVLVVALVAAQAACGSRDTIASAESAVGFCRGSSPPVLLDGTCTGVLSQRFFGHAACTCGALSLAGDLVTDSFDSRVAPWSAIGSGGDVGAEGGVSSNGLLQVGGSLAVSGGGVEGGSTVVVAGDLDVGGALGRPSSTVHVGGSARIAGGISVSSLSVGGTLTTPPGATRTGSVSAGSEVTAAVAVAPACPCDAAQALDVPALVAQHQATNDDAVVPLAPDALSNVVADTAIALPCGRFYLDRIQGTGGVTLRATGRAALFVGAGITLSGPLVVAVDPGAELDLFVAGPMNLPGSLRIGDPARPSAVRLWIAAGGAIDVPAGAQWAANLYAPAADLSIGGPLDLFGAVLVAHVLNTGQLSIHYDRAAPSAAAACAR